MDGFAAVTFTSKEAGKGEAGRFSQLQRSWDYLVMFLS